MNKVILVGRLARDPEVRYTQSGKATASFALAVSRNDQNKTADFIPIVCWEKLAEIVGNSLGKGRKILVEGRMQIRNYEGKDGIKRYVTEVVAQNIEFLDSKPKEDVPGAAEFGKEVYQEEDVPF